MAPSEHESWVTYALADPRSPWLLEANAGILGDTLGQMWAGSRPTFSTATGSRGW